MSAGPFVYPKYVDDAGGIHIIEAQPETSSFNVELGYAAPAGAAVFPRAIVSGSKRRKGVLHARTVTIRNPEPPEGYLANSPITLPIFTLAIYNALPMPGEEFAESYLDLAGWIMVSKSPEVKR